MGFHVTFNGLCAFVRRFDQNKKLFMVTVLLASGPHDAPHDPTLLIPRESLPTNQQFADKFVSVDGKAYAMWNLEGYDLQITLPMEIDPKPVVHQGHRTAATSGGRYWEKKKPEQNDDKADWSWVAEASKAGPKNKKCGEVCPCLLYTPEPCPKMDSCAGPQLPIRGRVEFYVGELKAGDIIDKDDAIWTFDSKDQYSQVLANAAQLEISASSGLQLTLSRWDQTSTRVIDPLPGAAIQVNNLPRNMNGDSLRHFRFYWELSENCYGRWKDPDWPKMPLAVTPVACPPSDFCAGCP